MAEILGDVERAELEQRLKQFYGTYYSELRERMSQYATPSEIFPWYLKGSRRIVAVLARDGVAVTHFLAERDSFEFRVAPDQRVTSVTAERAIPLPHGLLFSPFPANVEEPDRDFDGAYTAHGVEAEYGGQIIRPNYARLDVAATHTVNEDLYGVEKAREDASKDVLLAANAYLLGLKELHPQQQESRVISELQYAIDEFSQVIETHAHDEKTIQAYLGAARNQMLLAPNRVKITREVIIGQKRADFVIEMPGQRYVLVEIEKPIHRMFTKEDRFTKETTHAQQQVEDWMDHIRDYPTEFREKIMPGIRELEAWVVIGRSRDMSQTQRRALQGKNARLQDITIMTYDDLLDNAKQFLDNLRRI